MNHRSRMYNGCSWNFQEAGMKDGEHADVGKNTRAKSMQAVEQALKRKHDAGKHHTHRAGGASKAILHGTISVQNSLARNTVHMVGNLFSEEGVHVISHRLTDDNGLATDARRHHYTVRCSWRT